MILWIAFFGGIAVYTIVVEPGTAGRSGLPFIERFFPLALSSSFALVALRLLILGLNQPRLTLGPLGLIEHSTGRGLMLWSDFSGTSRQGISVRFIRTTTLYLHADREVVQRYNKRIPRWRRFPRPSLLRHHSIRVRAAALDHNVRWVHTEIDTRIQAAQ